MQIIKIKMADIVPYENNVKLHPKEQIEQIKKSIVDFGNNDPIAVDENNVIIEGHGRFEALKELGYEEAECIVLTGLTEDQKNAYRLVHNKLTMNSDFDMKGLEEELNKINMDLTAFDFAPFNMDEEEKEIIEDEAPEVDEEHEPITKVGDIWQLGRHRLMCGNSLEQKDMDKLLDGNKCELTFTDPPYQLETQGGGILKKANSMKQIKQNGVDKFEPSNLILQSETNIYCHNKPLIKKYIELSEANNQPYDLCFYKKLCTVPNYKGHMMTDCEYIAIIGKQDPNKGLPKEMYSKCYIGKKDAGNELSYSKPVGLCAKYIELYAKKNVLDLFGGSGSTLIACEQLDRKCYMMELDPKYCDVIIKRWETLTGKKAKLIKEGK